MLLLTLVLAAQAAALPAKLSAFDPLLGRCWRHDLSAVASDTHCFGAMYGGVHVRDRHEVKLNGKVVYSGETIYSNDGGDTVFTYHNSLGGVGRGSVTQDRTSLCFKGTMRVSPAEKPQPLFAIWKIIDRDYYEVNNLTSLQRFSRVKSQPSR